MRASLDEVVNTKLSAGGAFDSPLKHEPFFNFWRGKAPHFRPLQATGTLPIGRELRTLAMKYQILWLSCTLRAEPESVLFGGPVRSFFTYAKKKTDIKIQLLVRFTEPLSHLPDPGPPNLQPYLDIQENILLYRSQNERPWKMDALVLTICQVSWRAYDSCHTNEPACAS